MSVFFDNVDRVACAAGVFQKTLELAVIKDKIFFVSSRVGFTGFSISSSFSLNLVRDWLRLGCFIMVLDVDSLILPVEVVLGLVGSKKGYLFPSSEP